MHGPLPHRGRATLSAPRKAPGPSRASAPVVALSGPIGRGCPVSRVFCEKRGFSQTPLPHCVLERSSRRLAPREVEGDPTFPPAPNRLRNSPRAAPAVYQKSSVLNTQSSLHHVQRNIKALRQLLKVIETLRTKVADESSRHQEVKRQLFCLRFSS